MTGPIALLRESFNLYRAKLAAIPQLTWPLFALGALGALASGGDEAKSGLELAQMLFFIIPAVILVVIVMFLVSIAVQAGLLEKAAGKETGSYFNLKKLQPILGVVARAAIRVLGGLILLIVPGIVLAVRYSMAFPAAVLDGARGKDALDRSKELVQGRGWAVFWRLIVVTVVLGIIGSLLGRIFGSTSENPAMLGQIVTAAFDAFVAVPVTIFYTYHMYRDLKSAA